MTQKKLTTIINKKKLDELLDIQRKYKALLKLSTQDKKTKKVVEKSEMFRKMDDSIRNTKRKETVLEKENNQIEEEFKSVQFDFKECSQAFKNTIITYETTNKHTPTTTSISVEVFMDKLKKATVSLLRRKMRNFKAAKIQVVLGIEFVKRGDGFNDFATIPI
jgi:hypothetical protein